MTNRTMMLMTTMMMMMRVSCHILAVLAETLSYCCGHRSWGRKVVNV